jgi:hypothetical protein
VIRRRWFAPGVIVVVCWAMTTHGKYSASGDEPHYLMVCQSLWGDADLDLRNNYRNDDGERFGAAGLQKGMHARDNRFGALFPVHDLGVPVVLTPIYAAATALSSVPSESILRRFRMTRGLFAYSLISLSILFMVVAAAAITRDTLIAQGTAPALASLIVVAAWLSPPVLSNSFLVFPEAFALLATAFAVRTAFAVTTVPLRARALVLSASLGALPWFHRKYVVYAAALLVTVLWQQRSKLTQMRTSDRMLAAALFLAPQMALATWTWHYWGNLGGPLMLEGVPLSWDTLKIGSLGLLVDRESGLFVWAPIFMLLPAAWVVAGRRYACWLLPAACLFFLSAAHGQWWGGFSPAARFLVPLIPIFVCVAANALQRRLFRLGCLLFLAPQLLISGDGWQHTRSLWLQGDGHNRVLSDVLGWFGVSETLFPSLRTSTSVSAITRAVVAIFVIGFVNLLELIILSHGNHKHDATIARIMQRHGSTRSVDNRSNPAPD